MNKEMEKDVKVDRYKLEEAAEQQAALFHKYTKQTPKLIKQKGRIEKRLSELEAKLDLKIREEFEDEKITETAIKSRITLDARVKQLRKELLNAKAALAKMEYNARVFDQRRSMINYLAGLYRDQYWTNEPYTREEGEREFDKEISKEKHKKHRKEKL